MDNVIKTMESLDWSGRKSRTKKPLGSGTTILVQFFPDGAWCALNGKAGGGPGTFGSHLSMKAMAGEI